MKTCDPKLLRQFEQDDTVFHYTKKKNADSILESGELRFSKFSDMRDPFEKYFGSDPGRGVYMNHHEDGRDDYLLDWVSKAKSKLRRTIHVGSFCQNQTTAGELIPGYEKMRMWDQYGDGYQGICFAFSKSHLIHAVQMRWNDAFFAGNVDYQTLNQFTFLLNQFVENTEEEFIRNYLRNTVLTKHEDYRDEVEWRICVDTISNDEEYVKIPIREALKGIFVTRFWGIDFMMKTDDLVAELRAKTAVPMIELYFQDRRIHKNSLN